MKKRDGERYTVLVIEDNDHIRKLVEQILKSEGYETVSACGGREGLNCFRQGHPDIVLCDVMMPEVDGFDVLKEIRKEPRGLYLPFVFLTGKGSRDDVRSGMNLGADDYLMKPVTAGELIETVETRLRLNEARSGRNQYSRQINTLDAILGKHLLHELQTPLNTIVGLSELISIGEIDSIERAKANAEKIFASGVRLTKTINNLLLYQDLKANTEVGELKGYPGQLNRRSKIKKMVTQTALSVAEGYDRIADLHFEIEVEEDCCVEGFLVEKLLEELIDNAFKYSSVGQRVVVSLVNEPKEAKIELRVSDQGRGMSDLELDSIGAFVQFDRETHKQQGLGLGLAISQAIIKVNGSHLQLTSGSEQAGLKASFQLLVAK